MDFLELAAKRYSVRKFKEEKVRREDLDKILKAGMLAPTAHNDQPQRILVINSDEALEKLKKCTACHFNAPTALLICSDKDACWTRKYDGNRHHAHDAGGCKHRRGHDMGNAFPPAGGTRGICPAR